MYVGGGRSKRRTLPPPSRPVSLPPPPPSARAGRPSPRRAMLNSCRWAAPTATTRSRRSSCSASSATRCAVAVATGELRREESCSASAGLEPDSSRFSGVCGARSALFSPLVETRPSVRGFREHLGGAFASSFFLPLTTHPLWRTARTRPRAPARLARRCPRRRSRRAARAAPRPTRSRCTRASSGATSPGSCSSS